MNAQYMLQDVCFRVLEEIARCIIAIFFELSSGRNLRVTRAKNVGRVLPSPSPSVGENMLPLQEDV